jgi:DNA-binding transcriptional ArsR family regulator
MITEDNMNTDLGCSPQLIEETSNKLKVLGHPIRLKLLCMMERQTACVTDMWQCLDQPQPVISQHLAVLKDKDIVESVHDGNKSDIPGGGPLHQKVSSRASASLPSPFN